MFQLKLVHPNFLSDVFVQFVVSHLIILAYLVVPGIAVSNVLVLTQIRAVLNGLHSSFPIHNFPHSVSYINSE